MSKALENVGAGLEHLSEGQGREGAPKAPEVHNKALPNANGSGDGIVPKENTTPKPVETPAPKVEDQVEPKVEEGDDDDVPAVVVEYQEWDDPSANAAVELLKEAGVSAAQAGDIFNKAIESGNLTDIDVKALEAKVGKTKALLIMNGVTDFHRRTTEANNTTTTAVKEIFGGDAGWNTVRDWAQAKEKVDPAFKKELDDIREDLNKGPRAAKAAAKDLLKLYNGAPTTKGLGNQNLVKGERKPAGNAQPLSRGDYLTELKKAHREGATPTAIAQLDARRLAGKKAGI